MKYVTLNLLLALIWMFLVGDFFTMHSMVAGFGIGVLVLLISQSLLGSYEYFKELLALVRFVVVFIVELTVANVHLARDVLHPQPRFKPGFIRYRPSQLEPVETVLLSNMISLTPGTLTVDVDEDGKTLYIHTLYAWERSSMYRGLYLFTNLIRGLSMKSASDNDPGSGVEAGTGDVGSLAGKY